MMASCSFSSLVNDEDSCGQSAHYLSAATCVPLSECQKEVSQHLNSKKVYGDKKTDSEMKLILARAGKKKIIINDRFLSLIYRLFEIIYFILFGIIRHFHIFTFCPHHRDAYGIGWQNSRTRCSVPEEIAAHKKSSAKDERGIDSIESGTIFRSSGTLIRIGSRKYNNVSTAD